WSARVFGGETDPALVAAEADPDGDGLANLLEYAFATDPLAANTGDSAPNLTTTPSGDLVFEFRRAKATDDLRFTVQTSTDLAAWTDSDREPELVSSHPSHDILRVTVPRSDAPRLFVRLEVATQP